MLFFGLSTWTRIFATLDWVVMQLDCQQFNPQNVTIKIQNNTRPQQFVYTPFQATNWFSLATFVSLSSGEHFITAARRALERTSLVMHSRANSCLLISSCVERRDRCSHNGCLLICQPWPNNKRVPISVSSTRTWSLCRFWWFTLVFLHCLLSLQETAQTAFLLVGISNY
jgi:hypothetical protein